MRLSLIVVTAAALLTTQASNAQQLPVVKCLTKGPLGDQYDPMSRARLLVANADFRNANHIDSIPTSDVQIETNPAVCSRISFIMGKVKKGAPADETLTPEYVDVLVIRLGKRGGYIVQTQWHSSTSAEFTCVETYFDPDIKKRNWLCG